MVVPSMRGMKVLYAYLQELSRIEEDQEMSGEEKSSKKQDLMKKVEELADKLHILYREADEEMNTETKADENQE